MQTYSTIITDDTTLILSTDSELFSFLKAMEPGADETSEPGVLQSP